MEIIDAVDELDVNPFIRTTYQINDDVFTAISTHDDLGATRIKMDHGGVAHTKSGIAAPRQVPNGQIPLYHTKLCHRRSTSLISHTYDPSTMTLHTLHRSIIISGKEYWRNGGRYDRAAQFLTHPGREMVISLDYRPTFWNLGKIRETSSRCWYIPSILCLTNSTPFSTN